MWKEYPDTNVSCYHLILLPQPLRLVRFCESVENGQSSPIPDVSQFNARPATSSKPPRHLPSLLAFSP